MIKVNARTLRRAFAFAALLAAGIAHASIDGTSTATAGGLYYAGLGNVGNGVGSGRYTLGDCNFADGTTTCTLAGSYVEDSYSTHAPGLGGTFAMQLRYSGNGPSPVIANSASPGSDVLTFSATGDAVFTLMLQPASGSPITAIYPAAVVSDSVVFQAFVDPGNVSCTGLPASAVCSVGQVGLNPGATITGGVQPFTFSIPQSTAPATVNYQGLWWGAPAGSESGWGLNIAHQGDTLFATWFTYDVTGKEWWLSMTANKVGAAAYSGTLYQTNGPPFNAVPFTPGQVTTTAVGTGTLTFASASSGTFAYTVNGVSQSKSIVPQVFGTTPTCTWGAQPDLSRATNFQDLWWASPAGSESGWGINFAHQGNTIFATWFTYDASRNPLWYSVTAPLTGPNQFAGTLYRTTGPAFSAAPFDPTRVQATAVGSATFTFANGNAGTFAYELNDPANVASQTKSITRQVFQAPGTVCQ